MKYALERPTRLKVVGYLGLTDYYVCHDEDNRELLVDMTVDGGLPQHIKDNPRSLIGRMVDVERFSAYMVIGHGVTPVDENDDSAEE